MGDRLHCQTCVGLDRLRVVFATKVIKSLVQTPDSIDEARNLGPDARTFVSGAVIFSQSICGAIDRSAVASGRRFNSAAEVNLV